MTAMKKYSRKQRLAALRNAKTSLAIEGIHLTQKENDLLLERAYGKITHSEFLARSLEVAKNVSK